MGMGTAYTAVAEGPWTVFHNPAGTARAGFPAVTASVGRMPSPLGVLYFNGFMGTRPFPILPGSTVGFGYVGVRQTNAGRKDSVVGHFSHAIRLPQFYLRRPVKVGGNFKIIRGAKDPESQRKLGIALDGGALADFGRGLKAGIAVMDLGSDVGPPSPTLGVGVSYRWRRRLLLSADFRMRKRLAELHPGLEYSVFQNLLKLRVGRGTPLDGVSQIAFGAGINFSPLILDFGMTVPVHFHRPAGGYQVSVQYRFGAPAFYGLFPGSAARQSEDLTSEIEDLTQRKLDLEAQATAAEASKIGIEGEVRSAEERLEELRGKLRDIEIQLERKGYAVTHPEPEPEPPLEPVPAARPKPKRRGPAPVRFPRRHRVRPGDTLRKISQKYYGKSTLWELIYEANPDKVERGLPVEGAILIIPKPGKR